MADRSSPHSPAAAGAAPSLEDWQKAASKAAPDNDVSKLNWHTSEGLVVKPLYTAADVAGLPDTDTLPGFAP